MLCCVRLGKTRYYFLCHPEQLVNPFVSGISMVSTHVFVLDIHATLSFQQSFNIALINDRFTEDGVSLLSFYVQR